MRLPSDALKIIDTLNGAGHAAYVVGGCVRDSLLGKEPKDYDIASAAPPAEVKRLFRRTADTGIAHGTVTVLLGGGAYEVTTFRVDGKYSDNRRPDSVTFTGDLTEDLRRRDFTVNAMAFHPREGFIDLFGGRADIEARLIRGVGDPSERFSEDGLRMLRAARFAAALGFEIEPDTLRAIYEKAPLLTGISGERVTEEFLKIIGSENPENLRTLADTRLLFYYNARLHDYLAENLDKIISGLRRAPGLPAFFAFADEPEGLLKALTLSNREVKDTLGVLRGLRREIPEDERAARFLMSEMGAELFWRWLDFRERFGGAACEKAREYARAAEQAPITRKDLAVTGLDITALGARGKQVGTVLTALLNEVLADPEKNNRRKLLEIANLLLQSDVIRDTMY
ncbi:MAG: CCA tRNA nucleotidyltransferase [Clostridiales bacterium]|jgi:tRNA nucleotidyltransferase (CCA-adding enzyme)|nr:CCA tRNA nucleotidyltransferase [Clostridiales bacterium]